MRKSVEINKDKLIKILNDLEANGNFDTRSSLFEAAAAKYGDICTPAIVYLRVKQWNVPLKTTKKKPGEHLKGGNAEALKAYRETGEIKPKRVKADCKPLIDVFSKEEGGKYLKLAKSVKRGSLKTAIKLKCLDCCALDKREIKYCACPACPLWPVRPYQPDTMDDYLANSSKEVKNLFKNKS